MLAAILPAYLLFSAPGCARSRWRPRRSNARNRSSLRLTLANLSQRPGSACIRRPKRMDKARSPSALVEYKSILRSVLENRPPGTRQRLTTALGKHRSIISQITNPSYSVPIPAPHLSTIFEICHFSGEDRREFLEAYARAHPRRKEIPGGHPHRMRTLTVSVPDLHDAKKNRALDEMLTDFARRLARLPGGQD